MNENTSNTNTLSAVPFHGDTIYCATYQNQPYTPMKPIVENLGLAWEAQSRKIRENGKRWGMIMMIIPSSSGNQETLCLPVRKLPAYLLTINPKKVSEKLREKIIRYQEESDDVLWNYWLNQQRPKTLPYKEESEPPSDNDMIIQDLYTMVARNLRGKDLDAQIALRERVKAAFECKPLPATETAPALPESNDILPLEGTVKQNITERSVIRFLRDGLHSLNAAYQHAGLLVNTGKCPIKGFRRSLYIACMSDINGAAAIVRAMIAAEEIPAAKR